jgi:flagellar basal-body rod protein FlgB
MRQASWILYPSDHQVLPAAGEQHNLPLAALDEMDAASRIKCDRLAYHQGSPGQGPRAPLTELKNPGRHEDQRKNAGQDTHDHQYGLGIHAQRPPIEAGRRRGEFRGAGPCAAEPVSVPCTRRAEAICGTSAFVCMHAFRTAEINNCLTSPINYLFNVLGQSTAMDPSRIGLFDLAEKRLAWTAQRQGVLAANIANANTPAFQARDVESFATVLSGQGSLGPAMTQPTHMAGTAQSGLASLAKNPAKMRSLDGNTVALDQQLTKIADTETTQSLVTTVWKKYMGMFSMALGRSG